MKGNDFIRLLQIINEGIDILNKNGYKIYDKENKEYYIKGIEFNADRNEMEFISEEENSAERRAC